jgi:hypothetical protein
MICPSHETAAEEETAMRSGFGKVFGTAALAAAFVCGAGLTTAQPAQAETRSYAVNMFVLATIASKANCPDGLNPLSDVFYKTELRRLGKTPAEIEKLMEDFPSGGYVPLITNRGSIDGKPANIYAYPWSQPDPKLIPVKGKDGFGFNLDGKDGPKDFIDPDTKERGVDNGIWRALGCIHNFHVSLPDFANRSYAQWDGTRDTSGAWLIQITADNWKNDDNVTIVIDKAIDVIERDANGNTMRNMTFRVDPSSRSRSVAHGKIVNGMLKTDPFTMHFVADPGVMPELHLDKAQMRVTFREDGSIKSYLGGYYDWVAYYWSHAQGGWTTEHASGVDMAGLYYGLKKFADFDPDPKTGEFRAISGTWMLDAVPAYIIGGERATASVDHK